MKSREKKEYSIKFRNWSYARYIPPTNFWKHLRVWLFGKWNNNDMDVWTNKGIRIFGIEFNQRTYL